VPSQWLAVAAGVDSRARARQLRQSWERLLAGRELKSDSRPDPAAGVRQPIVESWRRSLDTGLDPAGFLAPIEADPSETRERWVEHPLGSLTRVLSDQLEAMAEDLQSLIVVSDATGLLLYLHGADWLKELAADDMNFLEGARWSEAAAGTNAIGTALAADHALQVFAFEHFNPREHRWTCSAAPVHDPMSGRILGIIDVTGPWKTVHPASLPLVNGAARTMEECLAEARRDHDARLRRRYGDRATRSTDLLVSHDGYLLAGDPLAAYAKPLSVPEGGGDILLGDVLIATAEPLGHGEAYLVRRIGPCGPAHEQTKGHAALRHGVSTESGRLSVESDRRVSAYFEAALDCVIMADASGRVVEFNPAAERTFGYSRDEALGRTMAELIVPPSLRERHNAAFARFVETGHGTVLGRRLDLTGMRSDGSEFPVELALSQVEAEPFLICGALRDISAAKQAERHLRELADEQAALRRVATLVARESSPQQLFALVAEQVARIIDVPLVRLVRYESDGSAAELIGGWGESVDPLALGTRWQLDGPGVLAAVWRSRLPARLDDYTDVPGQAAVVVRQAGMRSAVASPITVEGRLWGAIAVLSPRREPLPEGTEARLADFTELIATAISNTEARDGERRLAEEQAALRRVAELVAREAAQVEVFAAVADAVSGLLGEEVRMVRYEANDAVVVAGSGGPLKHVFPVGGRVPLGGNNAVSRVFRTGKPVRIDDYREATGPIADTVSTTGLRSVVATPIVVEGRLWGTMVVAGFRDEPIAPQTESRLAQFTELVATALANAESRAELAGSEARARKLAEEQAALRRIATLVAHEASADEIFAMVAEEVGRVINVPLVALARYEPDGSAIQLVGAWSEGVLPVPIGGRYLLDGPSSFASVWHTRKPAHIGDSTNSPGEIAAARRQAGLKSSVASPILVEGRLWGVISVASAEPLPEGTDVRLLDFTELVATAIANSEAGDKLRRLVDEQAALRRVATLVAEGAAPAALFSAVTEEVAMLFEPAAVTLARYERDVCTVLAVSGIGVPVGSRWSLDVDSLAARVYTAGRPVHVADYRDIAGATPPEMWEGHPSESDLGVPIVVDGRLWGVFCVATPELDRNPSETAERIGRFTELVATAVSNATMRSEVAASRARVIAAGDEGRRRIERDLHDGAQQQLVALALGLRAAEGRVPTGLEDLRAEVGRFADRLTSVIEELREMSRGIHPAILTEGGLSPAIEALALRSPVPVKLNLRCERRLPDGIEVAAYYVVSEALTNTAKHAEASQVQIDLHVEEETLCLSVVDDGVGGAELGGAELSGGSGLIGLKDRVEALGGRIEVASAAGKGTRLDVELPLLADPSVASNPEELSPVQGPAYSPASSGGRLQLGE
jgi:PAS domain S-box-containing protein